MKTRMGKVIGSRKSGGPMDVEASIGPRNAVGTSRRDWDRGRNSEAARCKPKAYGPLKSFIGHPQHQ